MSDGTTNEKADSAEKDLVGRLADEYKILQDKIDKIGAFRFTIKGWSITVIIASIFAGTASKVVPSWLWTLALFGFLIGFFLFEKQQTDLRHRFGQRVLDIEDVMSRLLRSAGRKSGSESIMRSFFSLHYIPGLGHHVQVRRARRRGPITFWQSCVDADIVFYFAQAMVVLLFVAWRGAPPPQDRSNFGIVINAAPVSTPTEQKASEVSPPRSSVSNTRDAQPKLADNEKKAKKKKEQGSN